MSPDRTHLSHSAAKNAAGNVVLAQSEPVAVLDLSRSERNPAIPRGQIVWGNDAFVRALGQAVKPTGHPAENSGLTSLDLPVALDPAASATSLEAIARIEHTGEVCGPLTTTAGRSLEFSGTVTLLPAAERSDMAGAPGGNSPGRYAPGENAPSRYVLVGKAEVVEEEAHPREMLEAVARVSAVLSEGDESDALRVISKILSDRAFAWCGFFAEGSVLQPIDGLEGGVHSSIRRGITGTDEVDQIAALLAPGPMRTLELDLNAPATPASLSAQLLDLVAAHAPQAAREGGKVVVAPLQGRGQVFGLMAAIERPGAHYLELVRTIARRVGMAIDHVRLYQSEHALAETLQRALLPEVDHIDSLDAWTYYSPNVEHNQVGGDWYDVSQLEGGSVAVVVGDVVGHDMEAAAAMGQFRSVLRTLVTEFRDPGRVLTRLDAVVESMRIHRPASLVYAAISPAAASEENPRESGADAGPAGKVDTGETSAGEDPGWQGAPGWIVEYSIAGHLPPMIARADGVITLDEARGPLVGFGSGARVSARTHLGPGDALVLYTDGLVERRRHPARDGVARLHEKLATAVTQPDAASLGEEILRAFADPPEDDIAVVVIRPPDPSLVHSDGRFRRWRLPATVESVRQARRLMRQTCASWQREESVIELIASELVANAVIHSGGTVLLRIQETDDGVRLEVEDSNPVPPTHLEPHAARVGGYGMQIIEKLAEWGWRPSGVGKVVWARIHDSAQIPKL